MKCAHTRTSVGMRFAVNGEAMHAKLEARRDLGQCRFGAFAAGEAVGDDADVMAAVGLSVGEIEDVAEDAADRRAHRVQDTKRLIWKSRHDQNQRSPTSTVSPGLIAVPSGTTTRIEPEPSVWVRVTTVAPGARREAAGDRHRAFDAHIRHVGILAGRCNFAEDEERPVGFDLHRHRGFADIAVAQFGGDLGSESRRRPSARRHRADQRHGDGAAGIDGIGIGEAFLAVDHDPQPVAGIEPVGRVISRPACGGIGHRDRSGACRRTAVSDRVEIALRLDRRDRRGRAHAARQSERSQQTENNGAQRLASDNPAKSIDSD